MSRRLLIVTQAGNAWPSGWVRALIYRDLFQSRGIQVEYMSRQSPRLAGILSRRQSRVFSRLLDAGLGFMLGWFSEMLALIQERIIIQRARRGYDAIYLQKTGSLEFVSALRQTHAGRLVYDLNDAIWLPANLSYYANGKVQDLLRAVDAVTCDNPSGLEFARSFNQNVHLVPDPAQVEMFDLHRSGRIKSNQPTILGWLGTPLTVFNVFSIWEALELLFSTHQDITLRLVGTGYNQTLLPRFEKVRFSCVPYYSQADMVREVLGMDIGLFPLFNVEDSVVRGILKAAIYMSGEAAVVASPRGQVPELIQDGVNGMLADSTQEWVAKLEILITNHELRRRIALVGLQTVRRDFSLESAFQALLRALDMV